MRLTDRQTISHTVSCSTETLMSVGSVVRETIGRRTITQFCEDSGLSVGYVSRLLNGKLKSKPSVRTLAKIAASVEDKDKKSVFEALLHICGYSMRTEEMKREIQIAERTSGMLEVERKEAGMGNHSLLNLSASAVGLLLSRLLMMGVSLQPLGYLRPYDGIEFRIKEHPFERVIAIPGFCADDDHQIALTERNILRQLLKYVSCQKNVPLYLVLTNHQEVFGFISDVVESSVTAYIYVLLANDERTRFIKQRFFTADEKMQKAPFDFVNDAK